MNGMKPPDAVQLVLGLASKVGSGYWISMIGGLDIENNNLASCRCGHCSYNNGDVRNQTLL
jgi:hypothetical protein